jgi:hypothetical protein
MSNSFRNVGVLKL